LDPVPVAEKFLESEELDRLKLADVFRQHILVTRPIIVSGDDILALG
jgi:hypothetical protein